MSLRASRIRKEGGHVFVQSFQHLLIPSSFFCLITNQVISLVFLADPC